MADGIPGDEDGGYRTGDAPMVSRRRDSVHRAGERFRSQYGAADRAFGSGVIEAGCKTVIAVRLKRSGMFWTVRGANAIVALRCCQLNGGFESYWEARRAA